MSAGVTGLGAFSVVTSSQGGHSPDTVAKLCVDRLISVSDTAPPEIRAQAHAYKAEMLAVVAHYMRMAVEEDRRTTMQNLKRKG